MKNELRAVVCGIEHHRREGHDPDVVDPGQTHGPLCEGRAKRVGQKGSESIVDLGIRG
jgi:hypothetical protein